ncbi:MAG: DUF904 domain-containing protein [Caldimonas sp.]
MSKIEDLAERVERLLLRHDELQRTNALLGVQIVAITGERDSLRARLNAARGRIDLLLQRLPREAVDGEAAQVAPSDGIDGVDPLRRLG